MEGGFLSGCEHFLPQDDARKWAERGSGPGTCRKQPPGPRCPGVAGNMALPMPDSPCDKNLGPGLWAAHTSQVSEPSPEPSHCLLSVSACLSLSLPLPLCVYHCVSVSLCFSLPVSASLCVPPSLSFSMSISVSLSGSASLCQSLPPPTSGLLLGASPGHSSPVLATVYRKSSGPQVV